MEYPKTIRQALSEHPMVHYDGDGYAEAYDHPCEGARHHSPQPLITYLVPPSGDDDLTKVWLCGTCRSNMHVLQHLIQSYDGDVPWPLRREFGNILRALAFEGWQEYQDGLNAFAEPERTESA